MKSLDQETKERSRIYTEIKRSLRLPYEAVTSIALAAITALNVFFVYAVVTDLPEMG